MIAEFTEDEAKVVRAALRAYEFETANYLRSSGFEPCAPECEHCAPRVAHFDSIRRGLQQRLDLTVAARGVMGYRDDEKGD